MAWTQPIRQDKTDIFLYDREPTLIPYQAATPIALNPDLFTNDNDEYYEDLEGNRSKPNVDFTGVHVWYRRFGDAGRVWCPTCIDGRSWPYCKSFYLYSKLGTQIIGDSCANLTSANASQIFPIDATGQYKYPFRLILPWNGNPERWENLNLWNSGAWDGGVLIQHDGEKYDGTEGKYEYLITVGHPITTEPCGNNSYQFCFFDPEVGFTCREFTCPCNVFNTPISPDCSSGMYGGGVLVNDSYRLWVMKPGQEPLSDSVKRYKVLKGSLSGGFPTYGYHSNGRVTKVFLKKASNSNPYDFTAILDRTKPYSFTIQQTPFEEINLGNGQGEDGHATFTISHTGETIYTGWHGLNHGIAKTTEMVKPNSPRCPDANSSFFFDENNELQFNTYCLPDVYHPESSGITTDLKASGYPSYSDFGSFLPTLNAKLEQLGKPKIVQYKYPWSASPIDTPNFTTASETQKRYPLKDSPYLSRESKNTFFENANAIYFEPKKMLQSAELNELQEKFYKNQTLFIQHHRNWNRKKYLDLSKKDLFSTNSKAKPDDFNITVGRGSFRMNKCLPTFEDAVSIFQLEEDQYFIVVNRGQYLINTDVQYYQSIETPISLSGKYFNNLDFINIETTLATTIDLTTLTDENTVKTVSLNIDISNIISCEVYPELKDNSGGTSVNAPCGAKRNLLYIDSLDAFSEYTTTGSLPNYSGTYSPTVLPINSAFYANGPSKIPHILLYGKVKNGVRKLFYSNEVEIGF